jgi:predicted nucleic acid-binding protein
LPALSVVVDSSALVELLTQSSRATAVEAAIGEAEVLAPDLIFAETLSALRGLERGGVLTPRQAELAWAGLRSSRIEQIPSEGLLDGAWQLRQSVSVYDAFYVTLARLLGCPLVTGDMRLARVKGLGIPVLIV